VSKPYVRAKSRCGTTIAMLSPAARGPPGRAQVRLTEVDSLEVSQIIALVHQGTCQGQPILQQLRPSGLSVRESERVGNQASDLAKGRKQSGLPDVVDLGATEAHERCLQV